MSKQATLNDGSCCSTQVGKAQAVINFYAYLW